MIWLLIKWLFVALLVACYYFVQPPVHWYVFSAQVDGCKVTNTSE